MGWTQTYNGHKFDPMNVGLETIDINDIAHALSLLCRFNGHIKELYSVAQHCVLMSEQVEPKYAFHALLHDAAEAYVSDVPRPFKPLIIGFDEVEQNIMDALYKKLDLQMTPDIHRAVKIADNRILMTEKAQLSTHPDIDWGWSVEPYNITIDCWEPKKAEYLFRCKFEELYHKIG